MRCDNGCNYRLTSEHPDLLICSECLRIKAVREGQWKVLH